MKDTGYMLFLKNDGFVYTSGGKKSELYEHEVKIHKNHGSELIGAWENIPLEKIDDIFDFGYKVKNEIKQRRKESSIKNKSYEGDLYGCLTCLCGFIKNRMPERFELVENPEESLWSLYIV